MRILGGAFKGKPLKTPKGATTRPTQSILKASVFNICQHHIEGAVFLDLFAGSGSMGFEALSRGAQFVVFVEDDRQAIRCIRENLTSLKLESRALLLPYHAFAALERLKQANRSFTLIYLDPPYEKVEELAIPLLHKIDENSFLEKGGLLFLETCSRGKELSIQMNELSLKNVRTFGTARLYQFTR